MNFLERNQALQVLGVVADLYNQSSGVTHTTPLDMSEFQHATFFALHGVGTVGTAAYTVEACDDASGTNPVAIPFRYRTCATPLTADTWSAYTQVAASGYQNSAGSNQLTAIEVDTREMLVAGQTKQFLRLTMTETVVGAVTGTVFAVLSGQRHGQSVPTDAIA